MIHQFNYLDWDDPVIHSGVCMAGQHRGALRGDDPKISPGTKLPALRTVRIPMPAKAADLSAYEGCFKRIRQIRSPPGKREPGGDLICTNIWLRG